MTLMFSVPEVAELRIEHLLMDVNGTLTNRGALIPGLHAKIARLDELVDIRLVSADTFGTLDSIAGVLQVKAVRAATGADKLRLVDELGRHRCAVIGNGANDATALEAAVLGLAVLGPEGTSPDALRAADVVCRSVSDALDLLLDPRAVSATLRP